MGLLSEIVLLPLAPVRGVAWTIGQVTDAAIAEQAVVLRRQLVELERSLLAGEISEAEFDEREDELLDQLEEIGRGATR
ncbi:gas vesicle protein GvpG [Amycolatopsis minnesotensis]|uniref:Gas vesicle protein GvpG n=1 Tax=Amycolatopsis minnesotensis TaxID=337894 RepID=A0ABN2QEK2_9PSEU